MRKVAVIPARYNSKRFPGKVITPILSRPMLVWAYEAAVKSNTFDAVRVATDCIRVSDVCDHYGVDSIMTKQVHTSGSSRVYEVAKELGLSAPDVVVNIQADEPCILSDDIAALCLYMEQHPRCQCATLAARSLSIQNDNRVKVAIDLDGRALYFSRAAIPYGAETRLVHVGIYAYRYSALELMQSLAPSPNEMAENLEQLRLLDNGVEIDIVEIQSIYHAVDVPQDVDRVEEILSGRQ